MKTELDYNSERLAISRAMILNPASWPQLVLPVKNTRIGSFEPGGLGVIFAHALTTVVIGCISMIDVTTAERKKYPSVDAMLADGWVVD